MNQPDSPRKAHDLAQPRAFRGLSVLSIAAATAGVIAVGSVVAFSLIGESETAPENTRHQSTAMLSNTALPEDSPLAVHRHANAPEAAEITHRAESPHTQNPRISIPENRRTEPAQTAQAADVIAARQATEPHNFFTSNPRSSRPNFAPGNFAYGPTAASPRSSVVSVVAEKQRETKPAAKTPAVAGVPEISSPKPRTAEEGKLASEKLAQPSKDQNLKQETALPPQGGGDLSTLNPQLSTNKWPKPFTPEEERIRQQMGVQAFINFQYQLATGEKRELE